MISPITGVIGSQLIQPIFNSLTTQRYRAPPGAGDRGWVPQDYLTESVYEGILSQLPHESVIFLLYISADKGWVDGLVLELTFAKRRYEHFL